VDVKAGRRSDLAKYTDIARPCLDIHEHGGRLDAVGRQRAISGIGLAINSVRRPIGSSVFGLTLESRLHIVSKTFQTVWKRSGAWHLTLSYLEERWPFSGARMTNRQLREGVR
jgi:hypothetical protein